MRSEEVVWRRCWSNSAEGVRFETSKGQQCCQADDRVSPYSRYGKSKELYSAPGLLAGLDSLVALSSSARRYTGMKPCAVERDPCQQPMRRLRTFIGKSVKIHVGAERGARFRPKQATELVGKVVAWLRNGDSSYSRYAVLANLKKSLFGSLYGVTVIYGLIWYIALPRPPTPCFGL
jgi:hypothetical protein